MALSFRNWLQQKASAGDSMANYALDFMGDDAKINADWVGQVENPARHGGAAGSNVGFGFNGKNYNVSAVQLGDAMRGFANEWGQTQNGRVLGDTVAAGGASGGSTGTNRSLIDSDWARNDKYYRDLEGTIDSRKQAAQADVDRAVGDEVSSLTTQRDMAGQNLDREEEKLGAQYSRGLKSLGENVRNVLQGQQNQLGMYGAADSSAADMLGVAVTDMANQSQGEMKADVDEQLTDVGIARNQLKAKFDDELRKLNSFKQSKYAEIKDRFDSERNEILNKLNINDSERARALAQLGTATQGMISAVDTVIGERLAQMVQTYRDTSAPKANLEGLPEYKSTRVTPGALDAPSGPMLTQEQTNLAITTPRRREDTL